MNFEYYLKSIVNSTKDNESVDLGEPINLKKINEFSTQLKDVRISIANLEDIWKKRIKLNKQLIETQSPEYKKEIYQLIYKLNSTQILLKQKQAINEYIYVLSQYLKYLKIAIFKKDDDAVKHIADKFLTNKLNMTYLMSQASEFNENINEYEDTFNKLMSHLNKVNTPLESKISMVFSPKSPTYFKELRTNYKRQKYLMYHIGRNFINIINTSMSKREISRLFNSKIE